MGKRSAAANSAKVAVESSAETSGTVAYVRVSSEAQDLATQRDAIGRRATPSEWYAEKRSGKTTDRPELKRLMADVRAGKIKEVYVFRLDRLTRTGVADTFKIVDEMRRCGVTLFSVGDNVTIRPGEDITSDVLVFALGLAAKLEMTARNDRVAAARTRMQAAGQPWGRPPRLTPAEIATARRMAADGDSVRVIAAALGAPRSTVARAIARAA